MDHYLTDENWNALVDRLAGPHDPQATGWTKRDEVVAALMDVNVWPAAVRHDVEGNVA